MKVIPKKRGRPATGKDPLVALRIPPTLIKTIDTWANQNAATRSEAIRRLVELGLASARPMRQRSARATARASELATEQVDKLLSPLLTEAEQRTRKRRLIKGPREFREMRGDLPKPKS